jgi:uncharacterized membrane protein
MSVHQFEPAPRHRFLKIAAVFFGILLLGAFLRFYALDAKSIWFDEGYTFIDSTHSLVDIIDERVHSFDLPPLLFILVHFSLRLFGESDFALRLPSAMMSVLALAVLGWAGIRLLGLPTGLLALFLFALSPMGIHYAQEARPYSLLIFFSLISVVALWEALQTHQLRWWLVFALAILLNLYSTYLVIILIGAQVAFVLFWLRSTRHPEWPRDLLCMVGVLSTVLLLFLPELRTLGTVVSQGRTDAGAAQLLSDIIALIPSNIALAIEGFSWFNLYGALIPTVLWSVALAVGTIHDLRQPGDRWPVVYLATLLIMPVLALLMSPRHTVGARYYTLVLPFYLLLVARGLYVMVGWTTAMLLPFAQQSRLVASIRGAVWGIVVGGLFLLHTQPLQQYYDAVPGFERDKAEFRPMVQYVKERWQPGEVVLAGGYTA